MFKYFCQFASPSRSASVARWRSITRKVVSPTTAALIDALTPTPPASVSLKPGKKKANSVRPTHPAPTSTMPRALLKRPASSTTIT
jgi:hypothetical protein